MEVRKTIHTRVEVTQVQSLNISDKIQIIQLNQRYKNATPTTTSDIGILTVLNTKSIRWLNR